MYVYPLHEQTSGGIYIVYIDAGQSVRNVWNIGDKRADFVLAEKKNRI